MVDVRIEEPEDNFTGGGGSKKNFFWSGLFVFLVIAAIVAVYFLSGFFLVGPDQVGLIKRFGKYTNTVGPGLGYHLPFPFESVVVVDTSNLRKQEIGFRTLRTGTYQTLANESLMLTGDGNIVSVEMVIQYYVGDPAKLAFNIVDDGDIVKFTTESVLREEVASSTIDAILTTERDTISIMTAEKVQAELERLGTGIIVKNVFLQEVAPPKQVITAFDDVNSAKQDKEKLIYEAEKYKNDLIPKAEGEAAQMTRVAEGYAQERILNAEGEAERFLAILEEYEKAPDVTRTRMYLETLSKVLGEASKTVVLDQSSVLKLLELEGSVR
ncbi:FtsH protease activity modulator HflK [Mesotoga sp.]|jgi:membrane protease subunit HflK|uniref:Protein HflK n=2 Tax=Mesotoga infera TaxID=1236046 RepID=A0A101I8C7_9BACT|nr:MAG: HflK protein [Mesotoga infera]KUK90528.1 MAG: HflK protein [Mesotoga infera]